MSCPFLNKFPYNYLKRYPTTILSKYVNTCPVMSRRLSSIVSSDDYPTLGGDGQQPISTKPLTPPEDHYEGNVSQCPFFDIVKPSLKVASAKVVQDICEVKGNKSRWPSFILFSISSSSSPLSKFFIYRGEFQL